MSDVGGGTATAFMDKSRAQPDSILVSADTVNDFQRRSDRIARRGRMHRARAYLRYRRAAVTAVREVSFALPTCGHHAVGGLRIAWNGTG